MTTYEHSLAEIKRLVEKFEADYDRFKNPNEYDEADVRSEFINPMFRALGWDMENSRQVVHEDRVIVEEGNEKRIKHPDYGFRTGKDVRFYLEAKKPAVNLQDDPEPAYQIRRYGWSKKLPLSVLTDFEEFIIYNCTEQPSEYDLSHVARLKYITYRDYIKEWKTIYDLFSYEAVLNGALERFAEEKAPKGIPVDDAFLNEMEIWRVAFAKDIAKNNTNLTRRELNIAVQRTIDRLVFLRIAEDRNIEPYGRLRSTVQGRDNAYEELKGLYTEANDKYNSGLFHFTDEKDDPDSGDPISMHITIGGNVLQEIVSKMYYPTSPYEFSVLPSDILGQVYERFLGKVIELSKHSVEIEEKPEVRKAGGVYYTPTYIVDYIVEHTVGKLLDGKTPSQAEKLRILDPACGSGSFLIGAYQYILDWHLDYYTKQLKVKPNSTFKSRVRETHDESRPYALTTPEKKRILSNNIYGVDLDQQAVEVTKLSLLLKMLEDESASTTTQYAFTSTDDRLLPDLASNIKWGNSLIGSDFYDGKQLTLFDEEDVYRVKAFDWETEFADIIQAGGFDVIIGNPPYIRIQNMKEFAPETVTYYKKRYKSAKWNYDIYVLFVERMLELLHAQSKLGYILPHKFFNARYGQGLRDIIAKRKNLKQIVHFGDLQIFKNATTYTAILILNGIQEEKFRFTSVHHIEKWLSHSDEIKSINIPLSNVTSGDWNFIVGKGKDLFARLSSIQYTLQDVTERIFQGLKTGSDSIYIVEAKQIVVDKILVYSPQTKQQHWIEKALAHPLVKGGDSKKYHLQETHRYIIFPYETKNTHTELIPFVDLKKHYPLTAQYLETNKATLENREHGKMRGKDWHSYTRNQALSVMTKPKIFTPDISPSAAYSWDKTGNVFFTGGAAGGYGIIVDSEYQTQYILGLLNSKLLDWFLKKISTTMRGGWYSYESKYISHLPIYKIDFNNPTEQAQHDKMVQLVDHMLNLHQQLSHATGATKITIEKRIVKLDYDIDQLVYQLYGLTVEEIAIVESETR